MAAGWEGLVSYRTQFKAELEAEVGRKVQGDKIRILTSLLRRLVDGTPVDTGELRQGWHVSFGSPTFQNKRTADPLGDSLTALAKPLDWRDVVYVQNNVPHAVIVEFGLFQPANPGPSSDPRLGRKGRVLVANGFSTQAPRGIMGDAVAAVAREFQVAEI